MFTGLVQECGSVSQFIALPSGARLRVRAPQLASGAALGDSIAVNGCCLTVCERDGELLQFDLLAETLRCTNLGGLKEGSLVNLEPALSAHAKLGGHFVQGHVDCTSEIFGFHPVGTDHRLEIGLPPESGKYVVHKGSIAVNGISLTVAEITPRSFVLWIIPHTLAVTQLRQCRAGDRVNLEFDLLAKYVERLLGDRTSRA
jgi:riboflavin synthase